MVDSVDAGKTPQVDIQQLFQRIEELEMLTAISKDTGNALADRELNFRTFFNTIDHLLFVLDEQGLIITCNEAVTRKLGYSETELMHQSVLMVHPPERREEAGQIVQAMLAGEVGYCPVPLLTKDGRQIPVETKAVMGIWSGQKVIFGVTKDLSDIKASEEKFSKAFHASPALMAISEIGSGVYLDVNIAFASILGYRREEVIGKSSLDLNVFVYPADRTLLLEKIDFMGSLRQEDVMIRAKSGKILHGLFSAEYLHLQDKKVLLTVMEDITFIKEIQDELLDSNNRLELFFSQSLDGFFFMMLDEPVYWDEMVDKDEALDYIFAHQRVTKINNAMLEQYRTTLDQFIGKTPNDLFAHDREQGRQVWRQFFDAGHLHIDTDERRFDGSAMWVEGDYVCIYDVEGRIAGHFGIQRDVTDRKRTARELQEKTELVNSIFENAPYMLMVLDENARIVDINQVGRSITNKPKGELVGFPGGKILQCVDSVNSNFPGCGLTYHCSQCVVRNTILHTVHTRESVSDAAARLTVWQDGAEKELQLLVSTSPITGSRENLTLAAVVDITELKQVEAQLSDQRQKLANIISSTNAGTWEWNVQTGATIFNARWAEIIGYTLEELAPISIETWIRLAHPDDLVTSNALLERHFSGELEFYECEIRIRHKAGHWVWVVDRGKVLAWTEDGKPLRMFGTHQDITRRKQAEQTLLESQNRFKSLFEQTHDAVFLLDLSGKHIMANQRAADLLGYTRAELIELSINDISAELDKSLNIFDRMMAREHVPLFERLFRKKDGTTIQVEINVEMIWDKSGNPLHIQSVVRDISERKQAEQSIKLANQELRTHILEVERLQAELREQALRDPLTNLYNRRYLDDIMERELIRAKRENIPLSVVMLDIDHFKTINDTYGHPVGDEFIKAIAATIGCCTRGSDISCRFGGEEFLLVLPGLSSRNAVRRADELRGLCSEIRIPCEGKILQVTISLGVASFPINAKTPTELLVKADKALYCSKSDGRNRVTAWAKKHD